MLNLNFNKLPEASAPSKSIPLNDHIGLEIEVEGFNNPYAGDERYIYWDHVYDGSLRDSGAEFVFKQPLGGQDVNRALFELTKVFRHHPPKITPFTSIHLHLNVQDLSEEELSNLILLYTLLEPLLYSVYGEGRWFNNNCLPLGRCPVLYDLYYRLQQPQGSRDNGTIKERLCHLDKYCGLNLSSILYDHGSGSRGSVEFRFMNSTLDTKTIRKMLNLLVFMKHCSKNTELILNLEDLIVSNTPVDGFLHDLLKDHIDVTSSQSLVKEGAAQVHNMLLHKESLTYFLESTGVTICAA